MGFASHERIKVVNGYDNDAHTYVPVIIIGAGESGIAAACQLKQQLDFDQFRVYDRQSGIGGTWWINRYPGVACDIGTPYYSFSWRPFKEATELYPSGRELVRYFYAVAAEYGIVDKICLNTGVTELRWIPAEKQWQATLQHMVYGTGDLSRLDRDQLIIKQGRGAVYLRTEVVRAKVVISCVGGLVEPRAWPEDIIGWDKFKGPLIHTARWKDMSGGKDFTGKDIVVVGTGCSAAQVVPRLVHHPYNANTVTQIMRTAPWVIPKSSEPGGKEWYSKNAAWWYHTIPGLHRMHRLLIAASLEAIDIVAMGDQARHRKVRQSLEQTCIKNMHQVAPERYHAMLTPNYEIFCKRAVIDREWLQGLNDPRIRITTQKLISIGEDSVTLARYGLFPDREDAATGQSDTTLKADAIILANGFETTKWLFPLQVYGRDGTSIHDVWHERGGAQAYMGNAVDGFPNLFLISGPNTFTGNQSVILASENLVNYSIKFIRQVLRGDAETIEVKNEAEIAWAQRTQEDLKHKIYHTGGCASWYVDPSSGWNSTTYPRSQMDYTVRCWFPNWSDWDIALTPKGIAKQRASRALRTMVAVLLTLVTCTLWRKGVRIGHLPALAKVGMRTATMRVLESIAAQVQRLQDLL